MSELSLSAVTILARGKLTFQVKQWAGLVKAGWNVARHKSIKSQSLFSSETDGLRKRASQQRLRNAGMQLLWKKMVCFSENPLAIPDRTVAVTQTEPPAGSWQELDRVEVKDNIQQLAGKNSVTGSGDFKLWGKTSFCSLINFKD